VPSALIAAAILLSPQKPEATFVFCPKVGEKFYYSMEFADENGPIKQDNANSRGTFKIAGYRDGSYTVIFTVEVLFGKETLMTNQSETFYVNREGKWRLETDKKSGGFDALMSAAVNLNQGYGPGLFIGKPLEVGKQLEEKISIADKLRDLMSIEGLDPSQVKINEQCSFVSTAHSLTDTSIGINSSFTLKLRIEAQDTELLVTDNNFATEVEFDRRNGMPKSVTRKSKIKHRDPARDVDQTMIYKLTQIPAPKS
jgi:hypothetical protein